MNLTLSSPLLMLQGITQRSGTNYLYNLLKIHPKVSEMRVPGEDFLLAASPQLSKYVEKTASFWNPIWGGGLDVNVQKEHLLHAIGKGIIEHYLINELPQGHTLMSKTPSTLHVDMAPRMFPQARIIFLVRNPLSVVVSGHKSFGWTLRWGLRHWHDSARRILAFQAAYPDKCLVVRYEDLVGNTVQEIEHILEWNNLQVSTFPFEQIDHLPVVGSSTFGKSGEKIAWDGVKAHEGFDPNQRMDELPTWLAGSLFSRVMGEAEALGYHVEPTYRQGILYKSAFACMMGRDAAFDFLRLSKQKMLNRTTSPSLS